MKNPRSILVSWGVAIIAVFCFALVFIYVKWFLSNIPEEIFLIDKFIPFIGSSLIPALIFIFLQLIMHIGFLITGMNDLKRFFLFLMLPPVLGYVFYQLFLMFISYWACRSGNAFY